MRDEPIHSVTKLAWSGSEGNFDARVVPFYLILFLACLFSGLLSFAAWACDRPCALCLNKRQEPRFEDSG